MKKLFAIVAVLGLFGATQAYATNDEANNVQQTEVVDSAAVANDSINVEQTDSAAVEAPAEAADAE